MEVIFDFYNFVFSYNPPNFADSVEQENGEWRRDPEVPDKGLLACAKNCDANSKAGVKLRETMSNYFLSDGSVPWQNCHLI